ncbi:hypothetical protein STSP2_03511 [Anaerohalosphaera lusitana]|uniref:Outer membrane protein beta-barrel domain-containing protein n=1 Tax=Anaerohalosphaera lusitana TaxID=1936003 RepID=A0A1U9NR61_9BACT|nr:hypothetical protein [Anaerohalosphaera lusitana]AQT70305.1 hypothetical protein STSP2_03511 [Anaerohalosphaera lusitana]
MILLRIFTAITLVSVVPFAMAQGAQEEVDLGGWDFEFTPYFWAAEVEGDMTLRGRTGDVDANFSDIWDNLNIGLMGRIEGWRERWGWFVDGLYLDLESDFTTPGALVSGDVDIDWTILEFGLGYHLIESDGGDGTAAGFDVDLLAGGRYQNIKGELDIVTSGPLADVVSGGSFERRGEWVEPLVGGRLRWEWGRNIAFLCRGDIGGFSVGEASKLTWNILAGIDYELCETTSVRFGYRIFDMDYSNGSGTEKFGLDTRFKGPILGLAVRF